MEQAKHFIDEPKCQVGCQLTLIDSPMSTGLRLILSHLFFIPGSQRSFGAHIFLLQLMQELEVCCSQSNQDVYSLVRVEAPRTGLPVALSYTHLTGFSKDSYPAKSPQCLKDHRPQSFTPQVLGRSLIYYNREEIYPPGSSWWSTNLGVTGLALVFIILAEDHTSQM